jgi:hypothetical protein
MHQREEPITWATPLDPGLSRAKRLEAPTVMLAAQVTDVYTLGVWPRVLRGRMLVG